VRPKYWIRGLGVQDSGLKQDPLLRKYAFLSITWVPAIRIEHVRAASKGRSTRNVFCVGPMVICACGLLPNPAKVPSFQYRAWLCSLYQKFHGDDEKTRESRFWDLVQWPTAITRPKFQNSNTRHDGILSIGNFMLMINLLKTKKMCFLFSWQHAIFYLLLFDLKLIFFPFACVTGLLKISSRFVWKLKKLILKTNRITVLKSFSIKSWTHQ
jgi:hypothetical protein